MKLPKGTLTEEKKEKIKIKLDPKKKIGYEVRSVGPGGKTTVTKRRDMPGKEDVGESIEEASKKDIADLVKRYNKIKGKSAKASGSMVMVDGKKMKADDAAEKMAAAVMKMEGAKLGTMAYYYKQSKRNQSPADAYKSAKDQAARTTTDSQRNMSVKQKRKDDVRARAMAAAMDSDRKRGYTTDSFKPILSFKEDWQKVNRQDKTDGLSQKAVDAYRRENPGSKLQTAVTEKKPTGKRAARRKSFCSRMKGMKKRLTSAKTANDPDSRINKALRRWNC